MKTRRRNRVMAKIRTGNDPILSTVCEEVKDGEDVSGIIRDMMHILTNSETGVGLAAPQAGHAKRIAIIASKDGWLVLVNPVTKSKTIETETRAEGCLSYPGILKTIKRPLGITIDFQTEGGRKVESMGVDGFEARIIQHEIDHLNGKCKVSE